MTNPNNFTLSPVEPEQIPTKPATTKILGVGAAVIGALILGFAGYLIYLIFMSPAPETVGISGQQTTPLDSQYIPEVSEFSIVSNPVTNASQVQTANVSAITTSIEPGYFINYQIEDKNKNVVGQGVVHNKEINSRIVIAEGQNTFTLSLRASNGHQFSEWLDKATTDVVGEPVPNNPTASNGINTEAEPFEDYYDTAWAKANPGLENFKLGLQAAWGATEISEEEYRELWSDPYYARCMGINYVYDLSAGEMPKPLPSKVPAGMFLKFQAGIYDPGAQTMFVQFFWCVTP